MPAKLVLLLVKKMVWSLAGISGFANKQKRQQTTLSREQECAVGLMACRII